jgi:hypothetical protein
MTANDRRNSHKICADAEITALRIERSGYLPEANHNLSMIIRETAGWLDYTWHKYWYKNSFNTPPHISDRMRDAALTLDGEWKPEMPSGDELVSLLRESVSLIRKMDADEEARDNKGNLLEERQ